MKTTASIVRARAQMNTRIGVAVSRRRSFDADSYADVIGATPSSSVEANVFHRSTEQYTYIA